MSAGCCTAHPVAQDHLSGAINSAGTSIAPAHHAKKSPTSAAADTLVVGTISTGNPAAPTAEAMAISGGSSNRCREVNSSR